ncbi:MAG: hypothetical protein U5K32_06150 [Bacteroidales bacterium]|nr:hypothetical protein [Bacteroidales bacterium]
MKFLAGFIIIAVLAFGIFMLVKLLLVIARRVEDKDRETFEKRKN